MRRLNPNHQTGNGYPGGELSTTAVKLTYEVNTGIDIAIGDGDSE